MKELSKIEERVLNHVQKDWKITENPYKELSDELNIDEDNLIQIIGNLKKENIIRDISAIFNARSLGYSSVLIAFRIPKDEIDNAASIINEHPGVSHNYLRDHDYNIWFTLAVERDRSIENEAKMLASKANTEDYLIFRSEKVVKIGLMLRIGNEEEIQERGNIINNNFRELSPEEKKSVRILQTDLPLMQRPFAHLIEQLNTDISEKRIVQIGEALKKENIMRRYGAVLKHNKAGYKFNAMTAWNTGACDENVVAKIFSKVPNISHLYFRTVYPGKWEHGLFAMIHARSDEELNSIIKKLEKQSGITDYLVLGSLKEFKKKRIKYFDEKYK